MLHILLDTSGSMVEDSRHFGARYLLLSLRRFLQAENQDYTLYAWNRHITPLEDLNQITWGGALNPEVFQDFYREHRPILLISDGDFPPLLEFRSKKHCVLLHLGEDDPSTSWEFPQGRMWRGEELLSRLPLFLWEEGLVGR